MKHTNLSLALLACLPFAASAVSLAPNGRGEVLLFPYYTVESGHTTTLSVVNHSNSSKALLIRFRESANGRPVLTFNIYLGKHDTWTAALFSVTSGTEVPASLLTRDNSCTVPGIRSSASVSLPTLPNGDRYVPFRNFGYAGTQADGGSSLLSRTRSGFIEVIEMGTVVADSVTDQSISAGSSAGCATLEQAWAPGGYWQANPGADLAPPTGGLSGTVNLVDVSDGSLAAYRATALQQFSRVVQHGAPGNDEVTLNSANSDAQTAQSGALTNDGYKVASWPRTRAFEAVSAALSQAFVGSEFLVDPALGAASEWVVGFPTRNFHTDPAKTSVAVPPFTQRFAATSGFTAAAACEEVGFKIYNREGNLGNPTTTRLCGSAEVIGFGDSAALDSALLGARGPRRVSTDAFTDGQAELDFSAFQSNAAIGGQKLRGLPAIGFWLWRYTNSAARPGQLALYSGAVPLSGEAQCAGSCD